jgi:LysR family glycine cleavage system transcriptional activator
MKQTSTRQADAPEPLGHPPFSGLEAFRAVASHGSLTAAAEALGLTAGALSRRVAALESWLGTSLFERHGRGMRPTPDGQRFLARVEDAFGLIEAAADPWRGRRGSDVVRVSVLPSFARMWLLDRLAALETGGAKGPRFEHRNADVEGGEVDLAIRYGRGTWRGVDVRPLMTERLFPVAHRDVAKRLGSRPSPADLLAEPLIYDSDAVGWRAWLRQAGVERFRPRPHDRRFEDYGLVLKAAQAGLGIALARTPLAEGELRAAGLVRIGTEEVPNPLNFYLLTRQREARSATLMLVERMLATARAA